MKAFLLGAGASRGTFDFDEFPVPAAVEFGAIFAHLDSHWAKSYPALFEFVNHLRLEPTNWPLEPVWSCIDYYAKLQKALPQKSWNEGPKMKRAFWQYTVNVATTLQAEQRTTQRSPTSFETRQNQATC